MTDHIFFGYDSRPEISRDALYNASRAISRTGVVEAESWEDLKIGGRVLISKVLSAIDNCSAAVFDLTTMNSNFLFEFGYALARAKPIWLLVDRTDGGAKQRWKEFGLLSSVGYRGWANSDDIKSAYLSELPHTQQQTLYDDLIEPDLGPAVPGSLLHVPTFHLTDAAQAINRRLEYEQRRGVRILASDPTESGLNPLGWYAAKAYETECSIIHFEAERRELSRLHNPRSALVAGMAAGFDRPILMLAEEDYARPLDYEDRLRVYSSARECERILDGFLKETNLQPRGGQRTQRLKLATELRTLRFGEHVAENEIDTLSDYFIETSAFDDVMGVRNALFVGRKGTGKTANMYQAAARLSEDSRNLVVVVKPASYEFEGIVGLLRALPVSLRQYSIVGIWRFLLEAEIAAKVVETVEARPSWIPYTEEEKVLLEFVDQSPFSIRAGFGTRFERTVQALATSGIQGETSEATGRDLLNEALYSQAIERLRSLLGAVLKSKSRVAILIDNLDKSWDRAADLDLLSQLLLGLLTATGRVQSDFARQDYWRDRVSLTVATFLRSDIFSYLQSVAREPDKLPVAMLEWTDPELLVRVILERFLASQREEISPDVLWDRYFCTNVRGIHPRDYLLARCLPRPRDVIYFCNAAAREAANHRHERIEEGDVLAGEATYSRFAYEALLVENGITIAQLDAVLLEFAGEQCILGEADALQFIGRAGIRDDKIVDVFERLKAVSFLGVETASDHFEYAEAGRLGERSAVLARKLAEGRGRDPRVAVHPAFRAFLEMRETA